MKGAEQTGRMRQNLRKRLITAAAVKCFGYLYTLYIVVGHPEPEKNMLAFLSRYWHPS